MLLNQRPSKNGPQKLSCPTLRRVNLLWTLPRLCATLAPARESWISLRIE